MTVMATAVLTSGVGAKHFVSYNGQFHLAYPDTWEQIDFRSVDFFLTQNNADPNLLRYEAVFAPLSERPFYDEPYLLLTFDSTGELLGRTRDSAIEAVGAAFGQKVDSVTLAEVAGKLRADFPLYVIDEHMVLVQTDMHEGRVVTRRNLLAVRFTQTGVANFYFYASDSAWAGALPTFLQISESVAEGTTPAGAVRESVKIADISTEPEQKTDIKRYWLVGSGLVVILIVIMAARRRRREQERKAASS
jgi:hypothetical protein